MNEILILLWLADIAANLVTFFAVAGAACCAALFFTGVFNAMDGNDWIAPVKRIKWLGILGFCSLLLASILPSKNVLYAAVAMKVGKEVATSPIGEKAGRVLDAALDKALDSLQPKSK